MGNFFFEPRDKDIVDVEVFDLIHEFELFPQCLAEVFGVRVAFNSDNFDLVVLVLFFLELFQEFVLEIVDLDFL